jgi:hypothetical protein
LKILSRTSILMTNQLSMVNRISFAAVILFAGVSISTYGQNKTLGVGTATPNSNAALHVESPTNNQGVIIPRLTTAQRTGFTAGLTVNEIGLIVFDIDLTALAIWNGTAWDIGSKVGAPITISNSATTGTAAVLSNTNTGNPDITLNVKTNGTGENAWFEVTNSASSGSPVVGITNGTGVAGFFQVNNPAGGTAIQGSTNSNLGGALAPVGVYGLSSGTGSLGGSFRNTNAANTFPALYAETKGLNNTAAFKTTNATNNFPALYTETNGLGGAANFTTLNSGTATPGVVINYAGTGNALETTGKIQGGQFVGDGSLLTGISATPGAGSVTTNEIADNTIQNKDIDATTSIAGFKVDPNFGIQNVSTQGDISVTGTGKFIGDGSGLTNLPGGGGWGLTGNATTNPATNFIGTTDASDFVLKTNNTEVIKLFSSGQVGIGTTPVSAKLDIISNSLPIAIYSSVTAATGVQNRAVEGYTAGSSTQNIGVYGTGEINGAAGAIGVYGEAIGTGTGSATGLYGSVNNFSLTSGPAYGLFASAENGSTNWAGFFDKGDVHITNALSVGSSPGTVGTSGQVLTSQGNSAPVWANPSVGINSVTNTEIVDGTITSSDLSSSISIATSGTISASSFSGDGSALTGVSGFTLPYSNSPTTSGYAFTINNTGTGGAADFQVNNLSGNTTVVNASTTGAGHAIAGTTTGSGNAGNFSILNVGNNLPALLAVTNGTGPALQADQTNNGIAIDILNGTLKYSTFTVVSSGAIATKAGLYEIAVSGTFTLPASAVDGETCLVYPSVSGVTVESLSISSGIIRQFVRIGGFWKVVN